MPTHFDETVKWQYKFTIDELKNLAQCVSLTKDCNGAIEIDQMIEKLEELQSAFIEEIK